MKLSDFRTVVNEMRTVELVHVQDETPTVKSFTFKDTLCARAEPGQFVMIWIPGVDEVPMSLSAMQPDVRLAMITAESVGQATKALHRMKDGDLIGVRGPYGSSYRTSKVREAMIIGGGTGLASLAPLAERLVKNRAIVTVFLGAKTRRDLLFLERVSLLLSKGNGQVTATTEDGSYGLKGLVTEHAEKTLNKGGKPDMTYVCGPEQMMFKMFLLSEKLKVPFQASLERFMRCAIGLCGTCVVGKYRVCRDGPVFSGSQLREVKEEFGHFRRGFDGRRMAF
jgi:dihydroorotate dehydrogenase electron transfer subunit